MNFHQLAGLKDMVVDNDMHITFLSQLSIFIIVLAIGLVFVAFLPDFQVESYAHKSGCHRWHTCPSDTGSYVCGDTGHGCGSSKDENTDDEEEDTDDEEEDTEVPRDDTTNGNDENTDSNGGFGTTPGNIFGSDDNEKEFQNDDSQESFPLTSPNPTVITNVNNNQVMVQNDRFTVQNTVGAVTAIPDCPPEAATIVLGPSPMQAGGARILAALDPCVLTDGTVVLNLPDEQGIQLVAANIQGGQTTQLVVVPMQRIAPITQGQTLYSVDLSEQITGPDPATGVQATLNGNINALFLLNAGGQNVEFSADNSAALNAILE